MEKKGDNAGNLPRKTRKAPRSNKTPRPVDDREPVLSRGKKTGNNRRGEGVKKKKIQSDFMGAEALSGKKRQNA